MASSSTTTEPKLQPASHALAARRVAKQYSLTTPSCMQQSEDPFAKLRGLGVAGAPLLSNTPPQQAAQQQPQPQPPATSASMMAGGPLGMSDVHAQMQQQGGMRPAPMQQYMEQAPAADHGSADHSAMRLQATVVRPSSLGVRC